VVRRIAPRLVQHFVEAGPGFKELAVLPGASENGHTLLGQNWDWLIHAWETTVVLESEQDQGPNFVTVVEAGLLAKTGMNAAGLGLVTNTLVSDRDIGEVTQGDRDLGAPGLRSQLGDHRG
jgi:hypothetical protein